MNIQWIGANAANFQKGRNGSSVSKIVLHWIVGKLSAADATFQDPNRVASAHYGIGNTVIHQYVKEEDTAYHAGNLTVNRQSIGIEHEGGPDFPISELTYKTSAELIADLCRRYSIPADRAHIIKHSEVPRATQCPGTLDVDRLVGMVVAILAPAPPTDMQTELDKVRKERDDNHNDRMALYQELGFDGIFVLQRAVDEIKRLKSVDKDYEAKVEQNELAKVQLTELNGKLDKLESDHNDFASKATATIETQHKKIQSLSRDITDLQNQLKTPQLKGFRLFIYNLLIK